MNWIDIIICIPLVWGFYKGITKGLVIELATIISLVVGIWAAMKFSELVSGFAKEHWGWDSKYLPVISFCIILLGVLILIYFIAKSLTRFIKAIAMAWLNKILGAVFGTLKFALLLSILFFVVNAIEKSYPIISTETKKNSLLYDPIAKLAPTFIPGFGSSKIIIMEEQAP